MTRRIDAHQHFWRLERGDYRWLTDDLAPLRRDFLPEDLAPILWRHSIDATVLVQAADTLAETEFLLSLADAHDFVVGVVGWVDFESRGAIDQLAAYALHPKFVGVRPMLQDLPDERWMLRPELGSVFRALVELDIAFDALVGPRHLAHLARLVERHPGLRVVIDHGAKPAVAEGARWSGFARWSNELRELARNESVHCKLSGLATEARPDWTAADLAPFVETMLDAFGFSRTLWGSDWPVVELARGYDAWWCATRELTGSWSVSDREAVLGGNAQRFYGLSLNTGT